MKRLLCLVILLLPTAYRPMPAYQIYDSQRKKAIDFDKMVDKLQQADVIFFGEDHNNALAHWLELRLLKKLFARSGHRLVLGAEMFDTDTQLQLNEYLDHLITEDQLTEAGRTWKNYKTDYAPLLHFARDHKLPFVATNLPKRYASLVARHGIDALDSLSDEAKKYMAPLPIAVDYDLSTYKEMAAMMGGDASHGGMNSQQLVAAQAAKDATMAWSIRQHWSPGKQFLHFNGGYHSRQKEGIVHYLRGIAPEIKVITIEVVSRKEIEIWDEEDNDHADFMIAIPDDMTKTY